MATAPPWTERATLAALVLAAHGAGRLAGIRFDADLAGQWQLADLALLRAHPWQTAWWLHGQPPLWNLTVAAALRFEAPERVLEGLFLGLSAALGLAVQDALAALGVGRARVLWALLAAGGPTALLFGAWATYDWPTAAAVAVAAAAMTRQRAALACAAIGVGTLLRSLLHPVVLLATALLGRSWAAAPWLALAFALVLRNGLVFGVPTTSTWMGMGLTRVVRPVAELHPLVDAVDRGELDPLALLEPFEAPDRWPALPGPDLPLLRDERKSTGQVNYHHAGWARVGAAHAAGLRVLLRHDPSAWPRGAVVGLEILLRPASEFAFLNPNRRAIAPWVRAGAALWTGRSESTIRGTPDGPSLPRALGTGPLAALLVLSAFARVRRGTPYDRWAAGMLLWIVAVGASFELGENNRYQLTALPLLWIELARRSGALLTRSREGVLQLYALLRLQLHHARPERQGP